MRHHLRAGPWLLALLGTLALQTACATYSTLQTARTLPKGQARVLIGGGALQIIDLADIEDTELDEKLSLPLVEAGLRYGLMDRFDMGFKSSGASNAVDAKYQFWEAGGLAVAGGFAIGKTGPFYDVHLPAYVSYDIHRFFGVYGSPRYNTFISTLGETFILHRLGASAGVRLGNSFGLMAEATYMHDLVVGVPFQQFNVSLFFGGESVPAEEERAPAQAGAAPPPPPPGSFAPPGAAAVAPAGAFGAPGAPAPAQTAPPRPPPAATAVAVGPTSQQPIVRRSGRPVAPGGYRAPVDLKIALPERMDPAARPREWVAVGSIPEAERTALYAALRTVSGGSVHVVFRNGASTQTFLEGPATTGLVCRHKDGTRVIYSFAEVEWVRAR